MLKWVSAHPLRGYGLCVALICLIGSMAWAGETPHTERDWYPYLSRTAQVENGATRFSVTPVSDWSYAPEGPTAETYTEAAFDFADLKNVWFVLEPQPGSTLAAHTFLLFEFTDDRLIGLTIEARRERYEEYSAIRGAFNAFELSYLWASARDLLTRRVVMLQHDVYIYPLALSEAQKQILLRRLLERTHDLETRPRFYNTLFSNCTNELAKATELEWSPAFILTGTSDDHLFDLGVIPGKRAGEDFATAESAARFTIFVQELNAAPAAEFDARLLQRLRSAR